MGIAEFSIKIFQLYISVDFSISRTRTGPFFPSYASTFHDHKYDESLTWHIWSPPFHIKIWSSDLISCILFQYFTILLLEIQYNTTYLIKHILYCISYKALTQLIPLVFEIYLNAFLHDDYMCLKKLPRIKLYACLKYSS